MENKEKDITNGADFRSYVLGELSKLETLYDGELSWREEIFHNLVFLSTDWIWMTDVEGKYIYVSDKVTGLYGYSPEDMIGKMPHEFVTEEYVEAVKELEHYLLTTHSSLTNYEAVALNATGDRVRTCTNCVPMFDKHSKFRGYLGIEKILEVIEKE